MNRIYSSVFQWNSSQWTPFRPLLILFHLHSFSISRTLSISHCYLPALNSHFILVITFMCVMIVVKRRRRQLLRLFSLFTRPKNRSYPENCHQDDFMSESASKGGETGGNGRSKTFRPRFRCERATVTYFATSFTRFKPRQSFSFLSFAKNADSFLLLTRRVRLFPFFSLSLVFPIFQTSPSLLSFVGFPCVS